jgi:hypothetical protein
MTFDWKSMEDNASLLVRVSRIVLLVLIIVGIGLIITRDEWVPRLVNSIIKSENLGALPVASFPDTKNKLPIACTMEAKLCPDGSYVSRTGPRCEFTACPTNLDTSGMGTVSGKVLLSPTCPVERIPPDSRCAPKGFETNIKVLNAVSKTLVKTISSKSDGSFSFSLPYGNYIVQAAGGSMYPRCTEVALTFDSPVTIKLDLSCDTGIR